MGVSLSIFGCDSCCDVIDVATTVGGYYSANDLKGD
jgi:hypothetical protein